MHYEIAIPQKTFGQMVPNDSNEWYLFIKVT